MKLGVKTLVLALVIALLAVPAAFAKGGHGGGKPSWAGGGQSADAGGGAARRGKPAWAGGGKHDLKAKKAKKAKTHGAGGEEAEQEGETETPAAEALDADDLEGLNPAWYCKTLRELMGEAFAEFGTNENKANAFGKCVSRRAHGEDLAEEEQQEPAESCEPATEEPATEEAATEEAATEESVSGEQPGGDTAGDCEPDDEGEDESAEGATGAEEDEEGTESEGTEAANPVAQLARLLVAFISL